nr:FUSC family protein [uncultured Holophaga sp.]
MTNSRASLNALGWDVFTLRRAFSLAVSGWIAYFIASALHFHNAYWAVFPTIVITLPTRGVLLERGVWRLVGTVIGASAALGILHLPGSIWLKFVALALWIALNAGQPHLTRSVKAYAGTLSGMTAAVVGVPALFAPVNAIHWAIARLDCTLIGVIVATLVMALTTPRSDLGEFYDQVRSVVAEAIEYATHLLSGGPDEGARERAILARLSHLESSARITSAGSLEGFRNRRQVDLLMVAALSAMAAARDIRDGLGSQELERARQLALDVQELRRSGTPLPRPIPEEGPAPLRRFDTALQDLLNANRALTQADPSLAMPLHQRLTPHREWGLAAKTGAIAGFTALVVLCLCHLSGIPALGLSALGVCIFMQVLGVAQPPRHIAARIFGGICLGALLGMAYRIWIQPGFGTHADVLITLVPFMLLMGLARAHPKAGPWGMDPALCFLMASQLDMPAVQTSQAIWESAALVIGAGIALPTILLFMPTHPRQLARRAAQSVRRDLLRILADEGADPMEWHARASRQILRLCLHLGRVGGEHPEGLLATLNLGRAVIDLHDLGMPAGARALLVDVLSGDKAFQEGVDTLGILAEAEADPILQASILRAAHTLDQGRGLLAFA